MAWMFLAEEPSKEIEKLCGGIGACVCVPCATSCPEPCGPSITDTIPTHTHHESQQVTSWWPSQRLPQGTLPLSLRIFLAQNISIICFAKCRHSLVCCHPNLVLNKNASIHSLYMPREYSLQRYSCKFALRWPWRWWWGGCTLAKESFDCDGEPSNGLGGWDSLKTCRFWGESRRVG